MPFLGRGSVPFPDHRRVHQARDPKIRGLAPAMVSQVENGNSVVNAVAVTFNLAGSHRRNPVLSGLGLELTIPLGLSDDLKGIYIYQKRSRRGLNLKKQATSLAPGVFGYEFMAGSGQSIAGTAAAGPVLNYVTIRTARGEYEKYFWAQELEADIVTLNGEAALDPQTLQPVEIVAEIVDGSRDWLEVRTDFMVGWSDEFGVLHRRGSTDEEAGFKKAYGGAAFVSFFDADPGTEGIGVQVNPLNQVAIENRRVIQVQNTVGLKEIVARFRSKQDSPYFVDVPLLISVVDQDEVCMAPEVMPCVDLFVKAGQPTPEGLPSSASVPMEQVVPGPDSTVEQDLVFITIRGATVGGSPKMRVRSWATTPSPAALMGARKVHVGDADYLPLIQNSGLPVVSAPYGDPHRYTIALSKSQLLADGVESMDIMLVDGTKPSMPVSIYGPAARGLASLPIGSGGVGTGGGPVCAPYALLIALSLWAAIGSLFSCSRPPTIAGLVVPVVVDAIEGVSCAGARSKIRDEGRERSAPAVTHLDAAASVVLPVPMLWASASLNHRAPTVVTIPAILLPTHPMRHEYLAGNLRVDLPHHASATYGRTSSQGVTRDGLDGAAGATASEIDVSVAPSQELQDPEASVALTGDVQNERRSLDRLIGRHPGEMTS